VDVTPPTEPIPSVTIDRLLVVPLTAGVVGSVSTTLAGACFGTMAYMRDFDALASCVDAEGQLPAVAASSVAPPIAQPPASVQGSLGAPYAVPCAGSARPGTTSSDGTPLHDEDVCVPGGAFVLGSYDNALHDASDDWPPQIAFVPSFYLDRYEVTVARYRAAGLPPGGAYTNDGPLGTDQDEPTACSGSTRPEGREEMPITCVSPAGARAFCQATGGDLPLEVQWEYAATMSGGRMAKTSYAWGDGSDTLPACDDVVYARGNLAITSFCNGSGFGPANVTAADHPGGDLSIGLSIVDLGGNAAEITLDTFASRSADCWVGAPLLLPSCQPGVGPAFTSRGGAWALAPDQIVASERDSIDGMTAGVGFRCARPGTSP
jgi:formylglycine-generating enzyme required for sulfatase activity